MTRPPDRCTITFDDAHPAPDQPYRACLDARATGGALDFTFRGHPLGLHALSAYVVRVLDVEARRDLALIELGTEPLPGQFRVTVAARVAGSTSVDVTVFTSRRVGPGYAAAVIERFLGALPA